jgi:hypothetical protein
LDEAFGHLALEHSADELKNKLAFVNMSEFDRGLLNDILFSRLRQRALEKTKRRSPRKNARVKVAIQVRGRHR